MTYWRNLFSDCRIECSHFAMKLFQNISISLACEHTSSICTTYSLWWWICIRWKRLYSSLICFRISFYAYVAIRSFFIWSFMWLQWKTILYHAKSIEHNKDKWKEKMILKMFINSNWLFNFHYCTKKFFLQMAWKWPINFTHDKWLPSSWNPEAKR